MTKDCIFCKIVNKDIPADIVYEDDGVVCFLDIKPINSGHMLVIPKMHYENVFDVPENILKETILRVKKMAIVLDKIADGVNIGVNNKRAAGQLVNHVHFHIIPRYEGDGLKHWPGKEYNSKDEMKNMAEEIKKIIHEVAEEIS
tara:strand:+ start:12504 stop:12935 length:432 start_codon:yes stop_codon:yes gene_type:complete